MRVQSIFALGDAMRPADAPQEDLARPPRKRRAKPAAKRATPKRIVRRRHAPKPTRARAPAVPVSPLDQAEAASRRFRVLDELISHLARIKAELQAALVGRQGAPT